jgi:3-mercaptopyruvate sulfurtransferase SseA
MSTAQAIRSTLPNALVSTDWARDHLDNPKVRFLEVDVDTDSYNTGHLPGATWFVLHELLGYENVRNYDGSWTEYGSLVGVPIGTGEGSARS